MFARIKEITSEMCRCLGHDMESMIEQWSEAGIARMEPEVAHVYINPRPTSVILRETKVPYLRVVVDTSMRCR